MPGPGVVAGTLHFKAQYLQVKWDWGWLEICMGKLVGNRHTL